MDPFLYYLVIFILVMFCCFGNGPSSASFIPTRPLCHEKESTALLKFKQSLKINETVSTEPLAHNKVASWKLEGERRSDCCSWDGVECNENTGRVISLDLSSSFLFGFINSSSPLFTLVHLQFLSLADNDFNYSQIPSDIGSLTRLESLNLSRSGFSGIIPWEISQLSKLVSLDLSRTDSQPSLKLEKTAFTNLLRNLTLLEDININLVSITSTIPDTIANLVSLKSLRLRDCILHGSFPSSFGNLSQLTFLDLSFNNLRGSTNCLAGLSNLRSLYLAENNLLFVDDLIWLGNLTKLSGLTLSSIDLSGSILSNTYNETHTGTSSLYSATSLPKFKNLVLNNCSLKAFPDFLHYQDELEALLLAFNMIRGQIPTWVSNISKESLAILLLDYNFLTGFQQHHDVLPWPNLRILSLTENMMQGQLPIPPPSVVAYLVSNNSFTGEIPSSFCQLSSLQVLQLDRNILTGPIPPCMGNFSDSLSILVLGGNNLRGQIPQNFKEGSKLKIIDLSHNQLEGKVPRSLENCKLLRSLDISRNLIDGAFPFMLGSLPKLQILLLGSNKLNGEIQNPISEIDFPNLRICDLSHNYFTGHLPVKYFQAWNAMKSSVTDQDEYMTELLQVQIYGLTWSASLFYSMTITSKGVNTNYETIQSIFTAIDLSGNKFEGEIPESIGNLKGLELLNISNNGLSGEIPSSLGNLNHLETLDISSNKLSGKIPQQLTQLTFLELFNVSFNNLSGTIPKGNQFNTFQSDSYEGNLGLCGEQLSRKCGGVTTSRPPSSEQGGADDGYVSQSGIAWVAIALGYVSGVIVGVVIGRILTVRYHDRFIRAFEVFHVPAGNGLLASSSA